MTINEAIFNELLVIP